MAVLGHSNSRQNERLLHIESIRCMSGLLRPGMGALRKNKKARPKPRL